MVILALSLVVLFMATAFGWRSWMLYRKTGDHGFRGVSGPVGSPGWWGGVLFAGSALAAVASPISELVLPQPDAARDGASTLQILGIVLACGGILLTIVAQTGMGTSWRIGVAEREETELVTTGLFSHVRNPIFTGMLCALLGLWLMVPNVLGALALGMGLAGMELQVRCVEEPYLIQVHGDGYRAYARRVGRFLPKVGLLR